MATLTVDGILERVQSIKDNATYILDMDTGVCDAVDVPTSDFDWLIKQLSVLLLEERKTEDELLSLLSFYSDKENYKENSIALVINASKVNEDEGENARKYLEFLNSKRD